LFQLGSGKHAITVHTYGVLLAVAILVAVLRTRAVADRRKDGVINGDVVFDASVWMVTAGIVGARLLFVIFDWPSYRDNPVSALRFWEGGISFHGALFGGFLALVAFCHRSKISLPCLADVFAPSVMLAYVIGRVGCFFNGCCYGAPTNAPWGVRFFDDEHGVWTPPSHPTQLYAAALSLVFFGLLVLLERRYHRFDGQVLCWYVIAAAVERFVMEIWRAGVTSTVWAAGLTDVQLVCIAMAVAAAAGLLIFGRRAGATVSSAVRMDFSQ
jgi:phosphatidylglycerol:prolipoprotein diacylglycerol transferase